MPPDLVFCPFSNDRLRDWPISYYRALAERCLNDLQLVISILGAPAQRQLGNLLVRGLPADRIRNDCGRLKWHEVEQTLEGATAVVGNNSGLAHLAGQRGAPTLVVFSGTVPYVEWMPRGPKVALVTKKTVCSPCGSVFCPYNKRCLREITPDIVFDQLTDLMVSSPP